MLIYVLTPIKLQLAILSWRIHFKPSGMILFNSPISGLLDVCYTLGYKELVSFMW